MAIIDEIKASFKSGSNLVKLIYINLAVFVLVNIVEVVYLLLNRHELYSNFLLQLALPADLGILATRPWTLITYMFLHKNFIHILVNILWLYWFGRVFMEYLDGKKLVGVYLLGGIAGGLLYITAFNFFPALSNQVSLAYALGASASVMAIVLSIAVYVPDYTFYLLFFGRVKIIYIAIIGFLVTSVFDFSINTGGKIAHIGGALFGYIYILRYRKGKDMTKGISQLLEWFFSLLRPRPKIRVTHRKSETDLDYNKRKVVEQKEIDHILDKIAKSGYNSLSSNEKEILFKQSEK